MSTELHERRAGFQAALNAALLTGNPTAKLRVQIADVDRQLAEAAQAKVAAAHAAQQAAEERIEAAGNATAAAVHAQIEAAMADLDIPEERPMTPDAATEAAALDLARCDAEMAAANAVMATAQAHHGRITDQIRSLAGERQAIVSRRAAGHHQPTDGAKLAELVADIEGLGFMVPEAQTAMTEARLAVNERSAARQRAVAALGRAEATALAAWRRERLDELVPLLLAILRADTAERKATGMRPDWVAPHELLRELQMRAAARPDLATGGLPGSLFPASAAYRPALRAV